MKKGIAFCVDMRIFGHDLSGQHRHVSAQAGMCRLGRPLGERRIRVDPLFVVKHGRTKNHRLVLWRVVRNRQRARVLFGACGKALSLGFF